jgi:aminocarboxymuconate-semialdehyde decarboxylase
VTASRPVVDAHAHFFPAELSPPTGSDDQRWPSLLCDSLDNGRILRGGEMFRPVRSSLWSIECRLAELDAAGVDVQLISPVPVTLVYWAPESLATPYLRRQNDLLADVTAESGGRLVGVGAVPLQNPDAAIHELRRSVLELGFKGVEIGTRIGELDLDHESLRPFFAAACDLGTPVFVHPVEGGGSTIRRSGQPYDFGLGMTTETAIAASSLVFGGVLEQFPDLKVVLSHGGGSFPATYPRMRYGAEVIAGMDVRESDRRVRSLYADAIVHDLGLLPGVVARFGHDHILMGSDCPFFPSGIAHAINIIRDSALPDETQQEVLGTNALRLFDLDTGLTNARDLQLEDS